MEKLRWVIECMRVTHIDAAETIVMGNNVIPAFI